MDVMSVEKRSALMSRIRGKGTKPELAVEAMILKLGLKSESHAKDLPGRPDFVFREIGLAVFVDGDFWHGWRFPVWSHKLSPFWAKKIGNNRRRDHRNIRKLRRSGWRVLRIWEHQIKRHPEKVAGRLKVATAGENGPAARLACGNTKDPARSCP